MRAFRQPARTDALAVLVLTGLIACSPDDSRGPLTSSASTSPGGVSSSRLTVVASGLDAPWSIAFHGEIPLVSERDSARVLELDGDGRTREVAVIDGVAPRGEGGLLGIVAHGGYLYVYFTADTENRIERFPLTGERGSLALGAPETVLGGIPAASYHDGGRIAFGPDGMLYATTGDAGQTSEAQDIGALGGKILRLTPEGEFPEDNPFDYSPAYSIGHRNPQGIAWTADGTMIASEFGQDTWDELNIIEAGGNYGWPRVEGIADNPEFIDPVQQWPPSDASPSGVTVLSTAGARESIFVANLRGERVREIPVDNMTISTELLVNEVGSVRDAVAAPDGALWLLTNITAGRGEPGPDDDRVLRFDLAR